VQIRADVTYGLLRQQFKTRRQCKSVCYVFVFQFLGAFATMAEATVRFVMSLCPRGTTRLPMDAFPSHFICQYFSKNLSTVFKFH
jgi:hypothetical protein